MTETIETAVKTDVTAEVKSLKSRMLALEAEGAGYVKVHLVWLIGGVCLLAGGGIGFLVGHGLK